MTASLRITLSEAARVAREQGPRAFLRHAIQALGLYRRLIVIGGSNTRAPEPARIPIECEELHNERIGEYLALRPDQSPDEIQERLKRGDACLVARSEGRLIAACWCATTSVPIEYLGCQVRLADDCVYAYDSYVAPSHRGQRVADGLRRFRMGWIEQRGFTRAIGFIWPENPASMHRSERMARNVIGDIVRIRLGPWQRISLRLEGKHADALHLIDSSARRA